MMETMRVSVKLLDKILFLFVFSSVVLLLIPVLKFGDVNASFGDALMVITLGMMIILRRLRVEVVRYGKLWFISGMLLIGGFCLSAVINTGNLAETINGIIQYLFVILLFPAFFFSVKQSRSLIYGFMVGIALNVAVAIIAWHQGLTFGGMWGIAGRMAGLFGNPNAFAKTMALAFVIFLNMTMKERGWTKAVGFLLMFSCVIGVMLSASFGGIIALCIGAGIYLIYLRKIRVIVVLCILFVVFRIVYVSEIFRGMNEKLNKRSAMFQSNADIRSLGSFELKMQRNQESLQWIFAHPLLGRGMEDLEDLGNDIRVHNWLLIAYEEGGLLSFLGVFGILVYLIQFMKERYRLCCAETRALAIAFLVVFILNAQTNTQMNGRFWWVGLFIVMSIINTEAMSNRRFVTGTDDQIVRRSKSIKFIL